MNAKKGCRILYGIAVLVDQVSGVRDFLWSQGRTWRELHPAHLGRHAAVPGVVDNEGALKLSDAGEHGQHHAPGQRRRVGPQLGQAQRRRSAI